MARKKKSDQSDQSEETPNGSAAAGAKTSTSALIICRNKHWRYISSFHGPWLQLPPEVLESLAHSNHLSPRPQPIDPAVFYDLVKIRKAVDEATNLAVRATSGLTSAALNNSLHAVNNMLGGAAALGIGHGHGGGGTSKLSRERKHRMRELATNKLSQAYHLDEIAASVATMQSASTLEDVAHLVLQRNPNDVDAKYVHFFHEKIPSRMMAQCTPLDTLDDIISERPNDGSPLRTRALTRIFKEDYVNSAKDLSAALSSARYVLAQHRAAKDQLVLARRQEVSIAHEDQPSSLETQLLFHRAGVYFTIACQHVHAALDGRREADALQARREAQLAAGEEPEPVTLQQASADRFRIECRKLVRQNAKRALRDYNAFLSHFDYTPGISAELAEEFLRRLSGSNGMSNGYTKDSPFRTQTSHLLDSASPSSSPVSDALVPHTRPSSTRNSSAWPKLPPPEIFKASQLFDAAPLSSLPPFPAPPSPSPASAAASAFADSHESITYHPLLTDALHSLLLCHALLQTPAKEHLRHAHNAARLARICDGYPIFLAARSPARADWIEVLRRARNWIGLTSSWETLCRPAPLPGHTKASSELAKNGHNGTSHDVATPTETPTQKLQRQKHEAILEALADERVVDEDTFQRAVRAREKRFHEDDSSASPSSPSSPAPPAAAPRHPDATPKRWAQDDAREYPISTERAEAIARWVREAPPVTQSVGGKKRRAKGKGKKSAAGGLSREGTGVSLAESVETLSVVDDELEGEGGRMWSEMK